MKNSFKKTFSAPWTRPFLTVLILRTFYNLWVLPYSYMKDTYSYVEFPFEYQFPFHVVFHNGRVPVYPILLRVSRMLIGDGGEGSYKHIFLVVLQGLCSLFCVILFYKVCAMLVKNHVVLFIATVFYGCAPAIMGWDTVLLTESLALSGTTAFLYLIIRYIKKPNFADGAGAVFLMFVLTFLRPTFLLFDALLLGFWGLRFITEKQERRLLMRLLACSAAVFLFIGGYSYLFSRSTGLFTISDPMPRQLAKVCVDRGYYKQSDDAEFVSVVDQALEETTDGTWPVVGVILDKYGLSGTQRLCKAAIFNNIPLYVHDTFGLVRYIGESRFTSYAQVRPSEDFHSALIPAVGNLIENVFGFITGNLMYLILLVELGVFLFLWIHDRRLPWIHLGLFVFPFLIFVSSLIATCGEYRRTMICVLPFLYVSMTLFLGWLTEYVLSRKTGRTRPESAQE